MAVPRTPKDEPVVGVVVPNKNGERYLRQNLNSILEQDYPAIDCVVMDSVSTDSSLDILREFGERIRWDSQPDSCAAQAINRGWQLLEAPILTWLNSDDMWAPGAIRKIVETFAAHPEAGVVSGECPLVDDDGNVTAFWPTGPYDQIRSLSHADHILNQPAVFMRREPLERVGWLREMWLHDHDLWLRLGLVTRFVHLDDILAYGRDRADNLGQDADLVGPLRIRVIEDFLNRSDLPPELMKLRRRSRSWAQLRAAKVYFASRNGKAKGMRHLAKAVVADPLNGDILRLAARRGRDAAAGVKQRVLKQST